MKRIPELQRQPPSLRVGSAMVFALVALLVASLIIATLLRTASLSHRQLKRDEFRIQAGLLADAGRARAIVRLQNQPDFQSEVCNIPPDHLTANRNAVVRLSATTDPDRPEQRFISVQVEYPLGHPDIVRLTRKSPLP